MQTLLAVLALASSPTCTRAQHKHAAGWLAPQALLQVAQEVKMPHNGQPTRIRVGIHTGNVVTGVIGSKLPKYSVFG